MEEHNSTVLSLIVNYQTGAIPTSTILTPIPADLFDSDSSHLGYDFDSDTILFNNSDSGTDSDSSIALF